MTLSSSPCSCGEINKEDKFDERQLAAQGRAYQAGFFTLLGYCVIGGALDYLYGWRWSEDLFVFSILGVELAMLVFVVLCIWHHAYIGIWESPARTLALWIFCGITDLAYLAGYISAGTPLVKNEKLQISAAYLGLVLLGTVSVLTLLLRRHLDRREATKEAAEE